MSESPPKIGEDLQSQGASARSKSVTEPDPTTNTRASRTGDVGIGAELNGKYTVIRRLGVGGMGSVWLARAIELDIEVAIKVVREDRADPKISERLLQEARAAARLGHPAIVRVLDFGRTELNDPYIVMEHLSGEDLGAFITHTPKSSPVVAVRTLLPIAHALAATNEKGIVHRDLKPENIYLTEGAADGLTQPKLIDFGIAKMSTEGGERITGAGAILGSPAYLSPEQASGVDVDGRTDIWAFTVVLYEMIAGTLPFKGANQLALLRAIIESSPARPEECDPALWAILEQGLQKEIGNRWPTMRQMGVALARWLLEQGITEDVSGSSLESTWTRRRRRSNSSDSTLSSAVGSYSDRPSRPSENERDPSAPPIATLDAPSSQQTSLRVYAVVALLAAAAAAGAVGLLSKDSSSVSATSQRPAPTITAQTEAHATERESPADTRVGAAPVISVDPTPTTTAIPSTPSAAVERSAQRPSSEPLPGKTSVARATSTSASEPRLTPPTNAVPQLKAPTF